jgi:Domain of unknown function (DUF4124)
MRSWTIAAALLAVSAAFAGDELYRWVDENGQVTYSDQPPPASVSDSKQKRFGDRAGTQQLPYSLQVALRNFPVVLFTTDCGSGCTQAAKLLEDRGVPYTEKNAKDPSVAPELMKLGDGKLFAPLLLVGKNAIKGYEESAWHSALDVAGYPRTKQLPGNYPVKRVASSTAPKKDRESAGKSPDDQ